MRGADALMSHVTDEWLTPPSVLERVARVAPIFMDPCAAPTSGLNTGAVVEVVGATGGDGLAVPWDDGAAADGGLVFVNPPYSDMERWAEKVRVEAERGIGVVLLVPARTDTKWFHRVLPVADNLVLWRGRIGFLLPDGTPTRAKAPFPSAILTFNLATAGVRSAFLEVGEVLRGPRWR